MSNENAGQIVFFYPSEIRADLETFCRSACAGVVRIADQYGGGLDGGAIGFGIEVETSDAAAIEQAASALLAWKSEDRECWACRLNGWTVPGVTSREQRRAKIEAIRRDHLANPVTRQRYLERMDAEYGKEWKGLPQAKGRCSGHGRTS